MPETNFESSSSQAAVADPELPLAHPSWVVYDQVCDIAQRVCASGSAAKLSSTLRNIWRVPGRSDIEARIGRNVTHPHFCAEFMRNGGSHAVGSCIVLLHQLAAAGAGAEDGQTLKRLKGFSDILLQDKATDGLFQPKLWSAAERAKRLAYLQGAVVVTKADRKLAQRQRDQQAQQAREERARMARQAETARRAEAAERLRTWLESQGVCAERFDVASYELLRSGELARDFREVHASNPSPALLRKLFALTTPVYRLLVEHELALERQAREKKLAHEAWERSLVGYDEALQVLFVTKAELDEWMALQRVPVAVHKTFRKWGQENTQLLFDPVVLRAISDEQIASWRAADLASMSPAARSARVRSVDKVQARRQLAAALASTRSAHLCELSEQDDGTLVFSKLAPLTVLVTLPAGHQVWDARVRMEATLPTPKNPGEVGNLGARVGAAFGPDKLAALSEELSNAVTDLVAEYAGALSAVQHEQLLAGLKAALEKGLRQQDFGDALKNTLVACVSQLLRRIEEERAQELVRLKDYPQAFPLARALKRHMHFRLGPTNSGKTHDALEALKKASSGLYLAPLRLLAMEIRDRLVAQGIPCNLLTGEEHDLMAGAQHTACTVEMMNPEREVEVAVIDEIQMLQDPARGWAWTSALVGAPARDVYVCGADTVHEACLALVHSLGEEHETVYLQRKTPLVVDDAPVGSRRGRRQQDSGLQAGDAVIAFSRKDVLTLSARYREQGFSVATIYGALAPEVRRTESERFATGEADIVVATDAIGMGLNLPVRRIIFSTVHKFDGVQTRPLNASEIQQIAGRAGRFGMHDEGRVTTLDRDDLPHVRRTLEQQQPKMTSALPIAPSPWHVDALSQLLGTTQVAPILSYFATRIASKSSLFETAALEEQVGLARVVDRLAGKLSLADKFTFSCAPIAHDKENELAYFETCLHAFVKGRRLQLPRVQGWLKDRESGFLEEAEFLSKDVSLYAWLSYKFPEVYCDGDAVPHLRELLSRYIERELLRQNGFGMTSKEAFQSRQRW